MVKYKITKINAIPECLTGNYCWLRYMNVVDNEGNNHDGLRYEYLNDGRFDYEYRVDFQPITNNEIEDNFKIENEIQAVSRFLSSLTFEELIAKIIEDNKQLIQDEGSEEFINKTWNQLSNFKEDLE